MISIVVPVYNATKTLKRCVNSLIHQFYREIEIILVDDGSTDGSGELCDELAKLDSRVRVIHKVNGGVSSARNTGIENAEGKYILFVDSDDALEPNCCKQGVEMIESGDAGMVLFGYTYLRGDYKDIVIPKLEGIYNLVDLKEPFEFFYQRFLLNPPWNKMFIREKIVNCFDKKYALGEDLLFNLEYIKSTTKIGIINKPLYIYYADNANSLTKIYKDNFIQDCTERYLLQSKLNKEIFGSDYHSVASARIYLNDILSFLNLRIGNKPYNESLIMINQAINNEVFISELTNTAFTTFSKKLVKSLIIHRHPKLIYYYYRFK